MILLAVDPSVRCTGYAVFKDGKVIRVGRIKPKSDGDDRYWEISNAIAEILDQYSFDALAIESQFVARVSRSTLVLPEVKGIIKGTFFVKNQHGVVADITPMEAKKAIGISKITKKDRKAYKEAAVAKVTELFSFDEKINDDVADAIAIGVAFIKKLKKKL